MIPKKSVAFNTTMVIHDLDDDWGSLILGNRCELMVISRKTRAPRGPHTLPIAPLKFLDGIGLAACWTRTPVYSQYQGFPTFPLWLKQCHKPSPSPHHSVPILCHGWFIALFQPHKTSSTRMINPFLTIVNQYYPLLTMIIQYITLFGAVKHEFLPRGNIHRFCRSRPPAMAL